jgi:uncharacterized SAM-binding protein YcdF (DUF218 family)
MHSAHPPDRKGCGSSCLSIFSGVFGIALLLLILIGGSYLASLAAGGILITADPLEDADAIVVLSGGSGERIEEAARIYKEKYADLLVLTRPDNQVAEGANPQLDEKLEAMDLGVPITAILETETHGNNTYEEAREVRRYLESRGFRKVLVVTDPFHTFRTRLIFREVLRESSVTANIRPVRDHWYRSSTWWRTAEGRSLTFAEYAKIVAWFFGVRSD